MITLIGADPLVSSPKAVPAFFGERFIMYKQKKPCSANSLNDEVGAVERTRTSTAVTPLEPESSASANSATTASGSMSVNVLQDVSNNNIV